MYTFCSLQVLFIKFLLLRNTVTPAVRMGRGHCALVKRCGSEGTSIALSERSDGAVGLLAAMVSDSDSVQSWHSVYQ
jgi:hypothetical protein